MSGNTHYYWKGHDAREKNLDFTADDAKQFGYQKT